MIGAFIHGCFLAFGLIIPLGVQNFFVFSQGAMRKRFTHVLPIVVTAAVCDSLLIVLAVSGVSLIILHFVWMKTVLVLLGAVFLVYVGFITWKEEPKPQEAPADKSRNSRKLISYTLMISILNPHAILDTIGVIGTSSINYQGVMKWTFTIACILVSWFWFFSLALLGRYVGSLGNSGQWVRYLNKGSAIVMWGAAIAIILTSL
jgi:L-lysine exporter family protein LysE/ArgO